MLSVLGSQDEYGQLPDPRRKYRWTTSQLRRGASFSLPREQRPRHVWWVERWICDETFNEDCTNIEYQEADLEASVRDPPTGGIGILPVVGYLFADRFSKGPFRGIFEWLTVDSLFSFA